MVLRPPIEHGDQHAEQAEHHDRTPKRLSWNHITSPLNMMPPADRADQRPGIGLDQMIIVVLRGGHVVKLPSVRLCPASSGPRCRFPPGKMCSSSVISLMSLVSGSLLDRGIDEEHHRHVDLLARPSASAR